MPLLVTEAAKLSREQFERGVIEEIIDKDELFALFPFMKVEGKTYDYVREGTLSEGDFLDPYEDVPEGAATFDPVSTRLRILAGQVLLDKFLIKTQSDVNDQLAEQISAKAKAMGRKFRRTLAIGDSGSNAKEFDGIASLTPAGQTLAAATNGAAVTCEMLDELKDTVLNGADVLMMRQGTWRAIRSILRNMGGNDASHITVENFGTVRAYDGTPVIINDFLPGDEVQGTENNSCSIYAMRLNTADGFHGIYGGDSAGLVFEDLGTHATKDAMSFRMKWYVGTALKATHAVARLKGITNI
ncbi:MAG: phage major capsid protein [Roseibium sp.]|nr:phage major capsid protein [Roseibium sp.]